VFAYVKIVKRASIQAYAVTKLTFIGNSVTIDVAFILVRKITDASDNTDVVFVYLVFYSCATIMVGE